MIDNIINPTDLQLKDEQVVQIKRISKATTGGRRMRFSAIVVVGDGKNHVGIGFGRANEVASAVNKAKSSAKKRIFKVNVNKGTITHRLDIKYGSVKLMLKPASKGTGIIASAPVRAIMEQLGITDILTKNTGSTNPINVVKATEKGLKELRDPLTVARQRGVTLKELFN
mgnify:CR=1 FL=1